MRLLLVEDDAPLAQGLMEALRQSGYAVDWLASGNEADTALLTQDYDAVILDLNLPGLDGLDVLRRLRGRGRGIPVLILSAREGPQTRVAGLDLGADDYVTKPYSPRELRARIKALLRRATGDLPEIYRFGDAEVDFGRRELRCAGSPVETTPLEFKLLEAFVHHRGRVLSRQQLLDAAWGRETFVTDRVVDNQVNHLRRKIEPDPSKPRYLISIRGIGYRFDG